jgi:HPt (histidine-containing phosphotransfer) domain-containing protein
MGADYDAVAARLRSEKIIQKFALKFLDDTSYELLIDSMNRQDYAEAFRAAHTLKGVCQNLGFDKLGNSSSKLTEALRGGENRGAEALMDEVKADYELTAGALQAFRAEQEV